MAGEVVKAGAASARVVVAASVGKNKSLHPSQFVVSCDV
jgi:hypothetical protein